MRNSLSNSIFDVYISVIYPREILKALENKYKTQKEGTNKYLVC